MGRGLTDGNLQTISVKDVGVYQEGGLVSIAYTSQYFAYEVRYVSSSIIMLNRLIATLQNYIHTGIHIIILLL